MKVKELPKLIVDTREPKDLVTKLKKKFDVTTEALKTGDYIFTTTAGEKVVVERKTISDFLGSISGKQKNKRSRLANQLTRMVNESGTPVLLLEGRLTCGKGGRVVADGRIRKWSYTAVDNYLLTIQRAGVTVAHCERGGTVQRIQSLITYYNKQDHSIPIR